MVLLDTKKSFVLLMFLLMVIPAKANSESSEPTVRELAIRVSDSSGKPIHGAVVMVKVPSLDIREIRTTNNNGEAIIKGMSSGMIKIQVVSEGRPTFGKTYNFENEMKVIEIKLLERTVQVE